VSCCGGVVLLRPWVTSPAAWTEDWRTGERVRPSHRHDRASVGWPTTRVGVCRSPRSARRGQLRRTAGTCARTAGLRAFSLICRIAQCDVFYRGGPMPHHRARRGGHDGAAGFSLRWPASAVRRRQTYRPPRTWRVITICGSAATMGSMNQASGGKEQAQIPRPRPAPCPPLQGSRVPASRRWRGPPAARPPRPAAGHPTDVHAHPHRAARQHTGQAHRYEAPATPLKPLPAAPVDLDAFRIRRRDLAGGVIHTYAQVV
jgi:hypothetical protein